MVAADWRLMFLGKAEPEIIINLKEAEQKTTFEKVELGNKFSLVMAKSYDRALEPY